MKTVWVICEVVDLGYHMVKGYDCYDKAKSDFEQMYAEAVAEKVQWLMKHGNYTKEQAQDWCNKISFYELESLEVEE